MAASPLSGAGEANKTIFWVARDPPRPRSSADGDDHRVLPTPNGRTECPISPTTRRTSSAAPFAPGPPALPTQVFLGLGTGGSDGTGLTGEPAGNGYARQRVTFSGTGPQQNTDAVRFTFTAGSGTLTHAGLFDAATGGNPLTWSALRNPRR